MKEPLLSPATALDTYVYPPDASVSVNHRKVSVVRTYGQSTPDGAHADRLIFVACCIRAASRPTTATSTRRRSLRPTGRAARCSSVHHICIHGMWHATFLLCWHIHPAVILRQTASVPRRHVAAHGCARSHVYVCMYARALYVCDSADVRRPSQPRDDGFRFAEADSARRGSRTRCGSRLVHERHVPECARACARHNPGLWHTWHATRNVHTTCSMQCTYGIHNPTHTRV
jgi:hypothetical protein